VSVHAEGALEALEAAGLRGLDEVSAEEVLTFIANEGYAIRKVADDGEPAPLFTPGHVNALREIGRLRTALHSAADGFRTLASGMKEKGYPVEVVDGIEGVGAMVDGWRHPEVEG
jgi:hypothetical protein